MKLLMITRKVDSQDGLAGFIYNWVEKIGENVEYLYVITWQQSNCGNLPGNIKIFSLPAGKLKKIFYIQKYLFELLPKVDGIFCHQNPEYTFLVFLSAKFFNKKIVTWYAHGHVGWKTKVLTLSADVIVTSSKKGFRMDTKKLKVLHQGIDIDVFKPADKNLNPKSNSINLVTVGRISPSKNYEVIIDALEILKKRGFNIFINIIGTIGEDGQKIYLQKLKEIINAKKLDNIFIFLGSIANNQIVKYLQEASFFLSASSTGSLDKAILEAMACGCIPVTSNEAFLSLLPPYLVFQAGNANDLADKMENIFKEHSEAIINLRKELREIIIKDHNLNDLARSIIGTF